MHYVTIAQKCLDVGKTTKGKTPERTVVSELNREIKGELPGSRFTSVGSGYYGLAEWEEEEDLTIKDSVPLDPLRTVRQIVSESLIKTKIHNIIVNKLLEIDPYDFEKLIEMINLAGIISWREKINGFYGHIQGEQSWSSKKEIYLIASKEQCRQTQI